MNKRQKKKQLLKHLFTNKLTPDESLTVIANIPANCTEQLNEIIYNKLGTDNGRRYIRMIDNRRLKILGGKAQKLYIESKLVQD